MSPPTETNRHFAEHNTQFRLACEMAGVKPTKRQASDYRRGRGSAYPFAQQARLKELGKGGVA